MKIIHRERFHVQGAFWGFSRNRRFHEKFFFLLLLFLLAACSPHDRNISDPPATPPLSRDLIGYGVVNVSYTRVMKEPNPDSVSLGYVREKTVVRILERRLVRNGETVEYWVRVEQDYSGWLPEKVVDIYDTGEKADTAAGLSGGSL
ncbi:MAG: hypothetical protein LBP29_09035 [Treponema sp.]|nr:hypothetical protein [Treponema sp.]